MGTPMQTANVPETSAPRPAPRTVLPLPWAIWFWAQTRKLVVFVVGMTVLAIGLAMTVLPGPAFLVIPAGLAILATEFAWARWLLHHAKERIVTLVAASPTSVSTTPPPPVPAAPARSGTPE